MSSETVITLLLPKLEYAVYKLIVNIKTERKASIKSAGSERKALERCCNHVIGVLLTFQQIYIYGVFQTECEDAMHS